MLRMFKETPETIVRFCERCGSVCDAACRANAIRERVLQRSLVYGWRQA